MPKDRRHKLHKPQLKRIPITKVMIDEVCLIAFGNLTALKTCPSFAAFDRLADILNVIALAVSKRPDLYDYFIVLQSAALAMEDIRKRCEKYGEVKCNELEYLTIRNAVNRFDEVMRHLDCRELYISQEELRKG